MDEDYNVFTMGFSNRSWEDTVEILQAFRIQRLVDIRTLPGSLNADCRSPESSTST
jgi:hypothetical protein